jgi:hypothetical protein
MDFHCNLDQFKQAYNFHQAASQGKLEQGVIFVMNRTEKGRVIETVGFSKSAGFYGFLCPCLDDRTVEK